MKKLGLVLGFTAIVLLGCNQGEIQRLQAENDALKRQVDSLTQKLVNLGYSPNASNIEQLIKNQTPNFTMLVATPGDYLEEKLTLYGYAQLRGYYNWGYSEAKNTHYSIIMEDLDYKDIYVYFPKESNVELFELLGKAGSNKIPLKVQVIELRTRYDPSNPDFMAEGLSWEVVK